jgi:hypothetical protein
MIVRRRQREQHGRKDGKEGKLMSRDAEFPDRKIEESWYQGGKQRPKHIGWDRLVQSS